MKPREYMTPKQVAAYFKVSTRTVDRRVESGDFPPPVLVLGMKRWLVETVEAYEARQLALATGEPTVKLEARARE